MPFVYRYAKIMPLLSDPPPDAVTHLLAVARAGDSEALARVCALLYAESQAACEDEVIRVSDAIEELTRIEPRAARVVEMRYFAGMADPEIAAALGVTERTVGRDWRKARLLLYAVLN